MLKYILIALQFFMIAHSHAQFLEKRGSITLAPFEPPKPSVFGVEFGSPPPDVYVEMQGMGLPLQQSSQNTIGGGRQVFLGVPSMLPIVGQKTYMDFFDAKLYRMVFAFRPSYTSFLQLKTHLEKDLGNRYKLSKESKDILDQFIKTKIAMSQSGELSSDIENEINRSVLNGTSFFYLHFQDQKKEVDVVLRYLPQAVRNATFLALEYYWIPGVKAKEKAYNEALDQKVMAPQ